MKPDRTTPLPQTQSDYKESSSRLPSPPRAVPQRRTGANQSQAVPRIKLGVVPNKQGASKQAQGNGTAQTRTTTINKTDS